jgi:hypothetical protein
MRDSVYDAIEAAKANGAKIYEYPFKTLKEHKAAGFDKTEKLATPDPFNRSRRFIPRCSKCTVQIVDSAPTHDSTCPKLKGKNARPDRLQNRSNSQRKLGKKA